MVTTRMHVRRVVLLVAAVLILACGCSDGSGVGGGASPAAGVQHPDVEDVAITVDDDGTFSLAVTMSSPYDTPDRYADGWQVLAPDGTQLGTMVLDHDHASEQPFTRTQVGLEIPSDVTEVTVEGHDQESGYGGATQTTAVPH